MANIHNDLNSLFSAVADSIRTKKESTEKIIADNFPDEIRNLKTGFGYVNPMVTHIADSQFKNCEELRSVDCPNLVSIGTSAFEGCSTLKEIIILESVVNISENVFKGCSEDLIICCETESQPDTWQKNWNPDNRLVIWGTATSVNLIETWDVSATEEDNVTAMIFETGDEKYILVLNGNGNMKNFKLYDNSNKTPWSSLYGANLTSVVILDGVTSIGNVAFYNCNSLTSITIPDSVISIGSNVFYNTPWLTEKQQENSLVIINNILIDGTKCSGIVTIPDGVTSIGSNTFFNCKSLTSVSISDIALPFLILISITCNPSLLI